MRTLLTTRLSRSIMAKKAFVDEAAEEIIRVAEAMVATFRSGGKLLIFGNGGSAADAQHMAAELVSRFLLDRRPLPAIALTTDTSILTAIANDFAYDLVFVKQVQALGKPEDMALGISTSGTSANVVKAMKAARTIGMKTVGLTGGITRPGGDLQPLCDLLLNIPSDFTPHIQETMLWLEHLLCEMVERELFEAR
ncbi:MAG: phosphoheptose isomerase [Deltaproteobacteria bacterium]|nr:MAG: phosphoheptose isomerase [Deltaproteobacteria bacterium]